MIVLLAVFLVGALILPALVRWLGAQAFAIAALIPAAAFVHALMMAPQVLAGDPAPLESISWVPQLGLNLSMHMDVLGWILTLIVSGVGALVLLYCRWYFFDDTTELGQFAGVLLGFAGAMYGLVLTDDIIMLVMFWEVTSILSYLLIGHYRRRAASRRAALQALLVTTLGGLVMFVGVVLLAVDAGTTSIMAILELAPSGPVVDAAIVMLLVGAISKSAIFPFHFWLPGAMAAPTPVSAYLHAAAMVKAGIYLIARFAPVFALSDPWRPIVISLGVFTMLLGGIQALRETDLKRVLAFCDARGVRAARSAAFAKGGEGSIELAELVSDAVSKPATAPRFLYPLEASFEEKVERIAVELYGADGVDITSAAAKSVKAYAEAGYRDLPVCVAKAFRSLSDDATKLGRPKGFRVTVREVRLSAGAGFLVALMGDVMTMPGLPRRPAALDVDVDDAGNIRGLMRSK